MNKKKKNEGSYVPVLKKKKRGTYREDREKGRLIVPGNDLIPNVPNDYDEDQKYLHFQICTTLKNNGILQEIGWHMIDKYCRYYKIWKDAYIKLIAINDYLSTSDTKYGKTEKMHPYLSVMDRASSKMLEISDRFGFTPRSQSMIKNISNGPQQPQDKDEFGEI